MNKALFATAFLVLLVLSHAETFEKAKLRGMTSKMSTEALFKSMKKSQFGKTLLSMLTLKFKTTGKLDELASVLQQLADSIGAQQGADDQNWATNSDALNAEIANEGATIDDATTNLADEAAQLADAQNALAQAQQQHAALDQEQQDLSQNLVDVAQIRANEQAAYQARSSNQESLVGGLQTVIQLFAGQNQNGALNQDVVAEIEGLLGNLVTAFQASLAEDAAAEQAAEANYQAYVAPRQARLAEIADALAELDAVILRLEGDISQLQDRIASEQVRLSTAEALLAQAQQQLKDLTERYTSNTATRSQQLNLLSIINSRLSDNGADVQDVLGNA